MITTYKIGSDLLFYLTLEILPFVKVLALVMINLNFLWSEIDVFLQKSQNHQDITFSWLKTQKILTDYLDS